MYMNLFHVYGMVDHAGNRQSEKHNLRTRPEELPSRPSRSVRDSCTCLHPEGPLLFLAVGPGMAGRSSLPWVFPGNHWKHSGKMWEIHCKWRFYSLENQLYKIQHAMFGQRLDVGVLSCWIQWCSIMVHLKWPWIVEIQCYTCGTYGYTLVLNTWNCDYLFGHTNGWCLGANYVEIKSRSVPCSDGVVVVSVQNCGMPQLYYCWFL